MTTTPTPVTRASAEPDPVAVAREALRRGDIHAGRVPERFRSRFSVDAGGCWLWTGYTTQGYGRVYFGSRMSVMRSEMAHRVIYEHVVGPIPPGITLDHLCRVRSCVNPAHLEPVTNVENVMRGNGIGALNARKTRCKRGHEFTPENTRVRPGKRDCIACERSKVARKPVGECRHCTSAAEPGKSGCAKCLKRYRDRETRRRAKRAREVAHG
jgi:hypothetical protein